LRLYENEKARDRSPVLFDFVCSQKQAAG